ncbi:MAG: carbohydrate ABC transporter permease [Alphaproteobacteria bacterium]|nr:carbohydrate ABC transporter permease [Alphaproteobacteria bacterium]
MTRASKRRAFNVFRHSVLCIWLLIVAFPIYWIVLISFKGPAEWNVWPPTYWPDSPTLFNYVQVWVNDRVTGSSNGGLADVIGPWESLINTFTIALVASTLATVIGTIIAYGASRYRILTDSQLLYFLLLRMVPPFVVAAPIFLWFSAIGLVDTLLGLIMLYTVTTLPYAMLVMKSFIDEIPRDIEYAAEMLGAARWQVLWEIVFPLLRSGLAATFMFLFILNWSEYFLALILSKTDVSTLPVHLNRWAGNSGANGFQAALSVGSTLPLIVIGLLIRKHLVRGLTFGFVGR